MPTSLFVPDFQAVLEQARRSAGRDRGAFPSPADWRDLPIYFLMLDRFNNPSAPPIHAPFDDPAYSDYQGGKFSRVRDQLAYIKQLGVGAIWLSPVLRNLRFDLSYHGYGIHDFLRAEPRFADDPDAADDELRALVDAAHDHGLYVVMDIVLNHAGDVFAYQCDPWDAACTGSSGGVASYHDQPQPISWRDQDGVAYPGFAVIEEISSPSRDAFVWPSELQQNRFFRRHGLMGGARATTRSATSASSSR